MTITFKNITTSFVLAIAIALTIWSVFLSTQSRVRVTENTADQPDAFVEHVSATIMNTQGKPSLKIESPKMIHYPQNDTTYLETPHVTIFRDSPEPWHINARYAKITEGLSQIVFHDDVIIHHPKDSAQPLTTMQTNTLTVFPNKKIAQTNDAITVTQPNVTIHAIGMLANMNDNTVKLLSQARQEYVPNS